MVDINANDIKNIAKNPTAGIAKKILGGKTDWLNRAIIALAAITLVLALILPLGLGIVIALTIQQLSIGGSGTNVLAGNNAVTGIAGGIGSCKTTSILNGYDLTRFSSNLKGELGQEDHIVTTSDPTQHPARQWYAGNAWQSKDGILEHLKVTNFSQNCPASNPLCKPSAQVWTPEEGGGHIGAGNASIPSAAYEPWVINFYCSGNPPTGSRIIVCRADNPQKCVVTIGGYECGPGAAMHYSKDDGGYVGGPIIAGARVEVAAALGFTDFNKQIVVGFAQDQTLQPGPIQCTQ
jgi:hypothetical protein